MNENRIIEHSESYSEDDTSSNHYLYLWMAFNVMYDHFSREDGAGRIELDHVCHCVRKLPYDDWIDIFASHELMVLLSITPIFDEKNGRIGNTQKFDEFKRLCSIPVTGIEDQDISKLDALMALLYLVRCNQVHGMKNKRDIRDVEVFNATEPILNVIVGKLAFHFGII